MSVVVGKLSGLARLLGLRAPGGRWRAIAILLALLNLKVLPFIWHVRVGFPRARVIHGIYRHLLRYRQAIPPEKTTRAIFEPVIIRTRAPMGECDYNLHKSNSTYFADMDVSRSHLVANLLKGGLQKQKDAKKSGEGAQGRLLIALGGVACSFKREIPPYTPYEMWSRIISWDQKWIYIATYFVKKGAFDPKHYTMQNETGFFGLGIGDSKSYKPLKEGEDPIKAIYAAGLSKYVFKSGRKTIPPRLVFERCGLLPETSAETDLSESIVKVTGPEPVDSSKKRESDDSFDDIMARSLHPTGDDEPWSMERVEAERVKGLELAQALAAFDTLPGTFQSERVLGRYWSIA